MIIEKKEKEKEEWAFHFRLVLLFDPRAPHLQLLSIFIFILIIPILQSFKMIDIGLSFHHFNENTGSS